MRRGESVAELRTIQNDLVALTLAPVGCYPCSAFAPAGTISSHCEGHVRSPVAVKVNAGGCPASGGLRTRRGARAARGMHGG